MRLLWSVWDDVRLGREQRLTNRSVQQRRCVDDPIAPDIEYASLIRAVLDAPCRTALRVPTALPMMVPVRAHTKASPSASTPG